MKTPPSLDSTDELHSANEIAAQTRGFLSAAEGELLYHCARHSDSAHPALEIGSYCGKSTVYLAHGCREAGRALLAVDHHRGSEEHQHGELFHDPELADENGSFDTLPAFRSTLDRAGLNDTVIPVLSTSSAFSAVWHSPLSLVFIDGGHSLTQALEDYRGWAMKIERGGLLAIHDVYPAPEEGGQAPITIYRLARDSGLFRGFQQAGSLRVLERR